MSKENIEYRKYVLKEVLSIWVMSLTTYIKSLVDKFDSNKKTLKVKTRLRKYCRKNQT